MPPVRLLGRYRLDRLLGTGAFATVHQALDEQLDDRVAVKILADNHAADLALRDRFVAEGQVLRRLDSPHLVRVYDLAESEDGRPFLVMQLCDRGTLRQRAVEARQAGWQPTDANVLAVAEPLAAAIGVMQTAGIVHRDLTPGNVLITALRQDVAVPQGTLLQPGERLVVADLGFFKDRGARTWMTVTGGTDGFRPPEQQTKAQPVDVRTDLYAAAAVVVWTLTGHIPDGVKQATRQLTAVGISPPVAAAVTAALHPHPGRRPASPAAWIDPIRTAAGGVTPVGPADEPVATVARRRVGAGRPGLVGAVGSAVIAVVVVVLLTTVVRGGGQGAVDASEPPAVEDAGTADDVVAVDPADDVGTVTSSDDDGAGEGSDGMRWAFSVADDDWAYDLDVRIDDDYTFRLASAGEDAPGQARLGATIRSGLVIEQVRAAEATDATHRLRIGVSARFDVPYPDGLTSGFCAPWPEIDTDITRTTCFLDEADERDPQARPQVSSSTHDPAVLTEFATAMNAARPVRYDVRFQGGCTVQLFSDGRVYLDGLIDGTATCTLETAP